MLSGQIASSQIYDAAIVGAGPAGSLTAARLAAAGLRILLLEASDFQAPRAGEFLSPSARAMLEQSAVLAPSWERGHGTVHEFLAAWGSPDLLPRNYIFDPNGAALALDRTRFDRELAEAAVERGANLLTRARVRGVTAEDGAFVIQIDRARNRITERASFLVVSAGRTAAALKAVPAKRRRLDGLVCLGMRVSGYSGDCAPSIESYARGWVYSVGLASGELVINVCTESDPGSSHIVSRSRGFLLKELASCPVAAWRLLMAGSKTQDFSFFYADASSGSSRPAAGSRWCLAGDQAQAHDPLSSNGIVQALRSADLIAEAVLRSQSFPDVDLSGYAAYLDESFARYLQMRRRVYSMEQRWSGPFWRRRTSEE